MRASWFDRAIAVVSPRTATRRLPPTNKAELVRLRAEVNKIGSNLNQLTRAANSGQIPPLKSLDEACEAFSEMRADLRRALGLGDDQGDEQ